VVINQCASNQKTDIKPISFTKEVPKNINKIYFKSGSVMQCDIVWEGVGSGILCKKSRGILAYSAEWVDLVKTFGETDGKEIAARYERIKKERELTSKPRIVSPEQERAMRKRERERSKIDMPRLSRKDLEEMFKYLPTAAQARARGFEGGAVTREEAIGKYLARRARHDYEQAGRGALERNRRERAARGKRVEHNTGAVGTWDGTFYAPTSDGGLVNTWTGEIIN